MKNKFIILFCLIALSAAFSGCGRGEDKLIYSDGTVISSVPLYGENEEAVITGFEAVDENEAEQILSKCEDIAGSYTQLYLEAGKERDLSRTDDERLYLSEEGYEEIFDFLSGSGIPLIKNTGDNYGALFDKSSFDAFWEKASDGEDAELPVYALGSRGDLYCYKFCCKNGEKYCLEAMVYWRDGELVRGSIQKYTLAFWLLTEKGNFIYGKQYAPRWMGNGYGAIHIGPVDEALEARAASYVSPVGYHGNGLFLCDWSEGNWGELNFNDLFEYLYRLKYGTYFQADDCTLDAANGCYYLDESLFEPVVRSYFDISAGDLRSLTLYDSARGSYPWQSTACNNYIYNGLMLPDVQSCTDNGDGTITMEIDVICPELETDCLFRHRLTVRPLPDGGFQYVSNELTYLDERTFPLYYPRIDDQRPEEYQGHKMLDVKTGEGREGELAFSFSLDGFIESFNSVWNSVNGEDYLPPSYMWSSYTCGSSIHSEYESVLYSFSGDEEIWSYPTVEAYTPTDKTGVLEIVLSFDDHGYTDYLYGKYEELCFYTMKVFFPDFEDGRLTELYTELIRLAYEYFPEEHDFSYGAVPSVLYYTNGIGLYPYFADGGTVKLCVIPVEDAILKDFEAKGTVLNEIE